jgi:hypothetical protein
MAFSGTNNSRRKYEVTSGPTCYSRVSKNKSVRKTKENLET